MKTLRAAHQRGYANHGWLESWHSFSFAEYYDPKHMGFGPLRVINDDFIAPGGGFPTHPHKNMEIITYVLEGAIAHKDSMGNGSIVNAGEVQYMSAGSGVRHSEFNPKLDRATRLLQIWIQPNEAGLAPRYEQRNSVATDEVNQFKLVLSPDGRANSIGIRQDAELWIGKFNEHDSLKIDIDATRLTYLHVARGEIDIDQHHFREGDAFLISHEQSFTVSNGKNADVLFFNLPTHPTH